MNTKEFLTKVLPERDNYVLWLFRNTKSSWNENHATLDEVCSAIAVHDKNPELTVYVAVGKFANNVGPHEETGRDYVQRKTGQATYFRALAADLDVAQDDPRKYKSQKEAVESVVAGCRTLGIPIPMIVLSGNGVHVWWPLTEDITADRWEKLSLALRAAFTAVQVKYDPAAISRPAMVLRPAGSHHKKDPKNWKEVRVGIDQPASDVAVFETALKDYFGLVSNNSAPAKSKKKSALVEDLLGDIPPIKLPDMRRCPQLAAILASNGAADAMGLPIPEPFWRLTLGIANFCEDREAAAIELSKGHPDFDEADCLSKLDGYKASGPPFCKSFAEFCEEPCNTCEHKDSIATPAQLTGGKTTIVTTDPETGDEEELELPPGYSTKKNAIFHKHKISGEETFVSPYIMHVTARVSDADEQTNHAKIRVNFPKVGEKEISVESSIIAAGGKDLTRRLSDLQVYITGDIEPLRRYLMTYLRKLQQNASADISYRHFGWQKDGTFLTGDRVIGAKRETHIHFEGGAADFAPHIVAKGSFEQWKTSSKLFDYPGLEFQNFAVSLALGAPLLAGTNIKAAIVNLFGKTGSGKSLTGKFGLSAWGNPAKLMGNAQSTPNANYYKFGITSNFGGYIDEVTTQTDARIRTTVMTVQDGKEKDRQKADTSGLRYAAEWHMPVIFSSNKDLYDRLKTSMNSGAEELRLLQLTCDPMDIFAKGTSLGRQFDDNMHEHYGHAGPKLVEHVIQRGGPKAVVDALRPDFDAAMGSNLIGQERFYEAMLLVAYLGGRIGKELGLIAYDPDRGLNAVMEEIKSLREFRVSETMDGFDTIFQFLTEHQDKLVYKHVYAAKATSKARSAILQPTPRSAVGRVELEFDANDRLVRGVIFINRTAYRNWCTITGAQYKPTVDFLKSEGVSIMEGKRVTLFKGVPGAAATGQTYCFGIDIMSHARLIAAHDSDDLGATIDGRKRLEAVSNDD